MDSVDTNQLQNETLESKIDKFFVNIEFSENQKIKIIECINKYKKDNNENSEEENIQTALRKLKRFIKKEGTEEGIAIFYNEINHTDNVINNLQGETINNLQGEIMDNLQGNIDAKLNEIKEKLFSTYDALKDEYKYSPNQEQERKSKLESLSPTIKSKLKEANVPEEQYADFLLARDRIPLSDTSSATQDFLQSLRDFEDSLGLRETTKKGIPLTYSETAFTQNPELNNFRENDTRITNINTDFKYFGENINLDNEYSPTKIQNIIQKYKHLEEIYQGTPLLQNSEKFQELSSKMNELLQNPDDILNNKEEIGNYINQLENSNQWITKYIQGSAAQAPFLGLLNYLDSYEDPGEKNFANQLNNLNIDLEQNEKDETMNIKGEIDGNPITFYYHLKDGQTNLECDDILKKDKIFSEGLDDNTNRRSTLNINMPSLNDIINNLKNIPSEKYEKILAGSNNLKEFQTGIRNMVGDYVKNGFTDNENIKNRLSRYTEKNLTSQSFISTFVTDNFKDHLNNKCVNEDNKELKDILELVDNTTERASKYELRYLKKGFEKTKEILNKSPEEIAKIKDPVLKGYLLDFKNAILTRNETLREKTFLNFFNLFKHEEAGDPDYKIDINDFNKFIELSENGLNTNENDLIGFSPKFQEKYKELNNVSEKKAQDIKTILGEEKEKEKEDPRSPEVIENEIMELD